MFLGVLRSLSSLPLVPPSELYAVEGGLPFALVPRRSLEGLGISYMVGASLLFSVYPSDHTRLDANEVSPAGSLNSLTAKAGYATMTSRVAEGLGLRAR